MDDAMDFDLLVIGAGSGGVAMSRRAALHGAKVAVIEAGRVGGTCVLRGCVPKKFLMYAAQYGDAIREAAGYGWSAGAGPDGAAAPAARFDMAHWAAAKAAETSRLEGLYRQMLAQSGVELIAGQARFSGPNTLLVATDAGERRLRSPHIAIASGAAPVRDAIPGIAGCATSDELLALTRLPERAAVVGGGYIGCEFASMLARLGVKVTLLYRDRLPLRGFDDAMREKLALVLTQAGVDLRPGSAPQRIEPGAPGGDAWTLHLPGGQTLTTPWVLNATGRRPNTAALALDRIGVTPDAHAAVPVDAGLNTAAPGVYAVGDVTNRHNLTPVAIAEGRWLADRLFGASGATTLAPHEIPTAVFTLPPLACVGLTESQALAQGRGLRIWEADFKPMRHAFTGSPERVAMKLIADAASNRVIGLHMLGADAPEIVQSLAVAITAGATKADFDRTLAVHPTTAEEWVLLRTVKREIAAQT
jgi:glutathione reductase (NADPH)